MAKREPSRNPEDYEYGFDVPAEVILEWLTIMAWDRAEQTEDVEVLRFIPRSDVEDSTFVAMPERYKPEGFYDKRGINEAVFEAYKRFTAEKKAERLAQYQELSKEFSR
jgi:hypothetical protein